MALATEVESVLDWCRSLGDASPDGVTISGGEPFDQPEALAALLVGLHAWRAIAARPLDILCYSGYPLRVLRTRYAHVLTMLDAVVPGPFVVDRPSADPMIGSENQRVLALSPLGNERYGSGTSEKRSPRLQMNVTDTVVWLIGIPKRGDLDAMASACADRGVILKGMSWRA